MSVSFKLHALPAVLRGSVFLFAPRYVHCGIIKNQHKAKMFVFAPG